MLVCGNLPLAQEVRRAFGAKKWGCLSQKCRGGGLDYAAIMTFNSRPPILTLAEIGWTGGLLVAGGEPSPAGGALGRTVWSGTVEDEDFAPSLRNWSPGARALLHRACDAWGQDRWVRDQWSAAGAMPERLIRPHHRHILSDHHFAKRFMAERDARGDVGLGFIADPAALLTRAMLALAPEHLARAVEDALATPGLAGVLMTNLVAPTAQVGLEVGEQADGAGQNEHEADDVRLDHGLALVACPLGTAGGVLDERAIASAVATAWRVGVAVIVLSEAERQGARALLEAAVAAPSTAQGLT